MTMIRYIHCAAMALMLAPAPGFGQEPRWGDRGFGYYVSGVFDRALREWQPMAEQGDAWAQTFLGRMYTYGEGVDQDHAEAMRWFRLAAQQGYAAGQYNLGYMYRNGEGVAPDTVSAYMWFSIADANGFADASVQLDFLRDFRSMTADDISEAERRARACMESGYLDCD